ncbi:MAG: flagellar biosynthetic protein FliO, partial [Xanthobacteraceae bacterium]|nr:flagellar biosynthetic protein FliO [Xanthobacteraceae bacterium]
LAVLGIGGYLLRRVTGGTLSIAGPRGRQPRLAVIDAASVDGRRRLVLVRRDNVEHLLLIGGPSDIVVEPNIDKAALAASAAASPALRNFTASPGLETLPRSSPAYDSPMSRDAMPRESTARDALPRESVPRETVLPREPLSRPASAYEFAPRPAAAYEPAPAVEETQWTSPEPIAGGEAEPAHVSVPEPVAAAAVDPAPVSWPAPEPLSPVEPARVEPSWPASEPIAVTPVEPMPWSAPEPIVPAAAPPPREAAEWPFDNEPVAPPLMPTPVEPEPAIPPPPAFEPVFETRRIPSAPPLPPRNGQSDASNLSEMAQRLEAALRRPIRPVERAVPTSHVSIEVPPPASAPPAPFELSVVPQPVAAPEPVTPPAPQPPQPAPPSSTRPGPVFTSIEEEMASLLGRSPGRP